MEKRISDRRFGILSAQASTRTLTRLVINIRFEISSVR